MAFRPLPFDVRDRAAEVFDELAMERPDEQAERIAPSLPLGIGAEHRNGAAQAVVLQNQLEAFPWMHPFLKRNLNRRAQSLLRLRCVRVGDVERVQRLDDRPGIADRAEIGPCVRNISIGQNQFADFARRLNVPVLIGLLKFFRHIADAGRWKPAAGRAPTVSASAGHRRASRYCLSRLKRAASSSNAAPVS